MSSLDTTHKCRSHSDMPVRPFFVWLSNDLSDETEDGNEADEKHGFVRCDVELL